MMRDHTDIIDRCLKHQSGFQTAIQNELKSHYDSVSEDIERDIEKIDGSIATILKDTTDENLLKDYSVSFERDEEEQSKEEEQLRRKRFGRIRVLKNPELQHRKRPAKRDTEEQQPSEAKRPRGNNNSIPV